MNQKIRSSDTIIRTRMLFSLRENSAQMREKEEKNCIIQSESYKLIERERLYTSEKKERGVCTAGNY